MTKEEWEAATNARLQEVYGIDLSDCSDGEAPRDWQEVTPDHYVDWVGEKYGLTDIRRPWA